MRTFTTRLCARQQIDCRLALIALLFDMKVKSPGPLPRQLQYLQLDLALRC